MNTYEMSFRLDSGVSAETHLALTNVLNFEIDSVQLSLFGIVGAIYLRDIK